MDKYQIALVFDHMYGDKLFNLADKMYTWIIGSKENYSAAKRYWDKFPLKKTFDSVTGCFYTEMDLDKGVTVMENISTPFDCELLNDIWDHHGKYAHSPPLTEILIIGLPLTDQVRMTLDEYGLKIISQKDDWFVVKDTSLPESVGGPNKTS